MSYFWNKPGLAFAAVLSVGTFGAQANETQTPQTVASATAGSNGAAAAPLDSSALALSAAIKADPSLDPAVYHFYAARGFRAFWSEGEGRVAALSEVVSSAPAHGLPLNHYHLVSVSDLNSPEIAAVQEIQRTKAYLAFAGDVAAGVLQPRVLDREIHLFPERPHVGLLLNELKLTGDPRRVVRALQPSHPHYARVQQLVQTLNGIIDAGDWGPAVDDGGSLKIGMVGPRVSALRARLIAMGDMAASAEGEPTNTYDLALELGVMAFQRRHGLNDDGVAGRRTIAAVNVSAAKRRDQALATLERLRWTNKDLGDRHIFVNLADFRVNVVDNGTVLFDERVVVGKTRKHRTPEFSDMMTYLVLNPTWNVPRSIATKEILPELQANPNYLAEKNMELIGVNGAIPPEPLLADWSLYDQSSFPFRIKQNPGAGNALGRVKFMFPNQFSIYLHDTPSKRLFAKDARAFSHGCVRVQDPMQLARVLLAPKYDDPAGVIERILAKGDEAYMHLAEPMPVHLTYRTAWVDDGGTMQFRADVYGRDALIRSALGELGVTGRQES
ncbi:MAG: L,D-transpeptidase family protein [Pikeienuella sp.]